MSDRYKEVLYEPQWQALRVSLLSKNSADGGFGSFAGTSSNLKKLKEYIDSAVGAQEKHNRLWRTLNLLNAVRMGFSGQKQAGTDKDKAVVAFRNKVQKDYDDSRKAGNDVSPPSEDTVRSQLKSLDKDSRKKIHKDLVKRQKFSNYSKNRPELHAFVKTVEEYID